MMNESVELLITKKEGEGEEEEVMMVAAPAVVEVLEMDIEND